jgi:serine phosphatase RsbU (regulator of sigma subunit)
VANSVPCLVLEGSGGSQQVALDHSPFTIGRREDNDLCVSEPHVSRLQARIIRQQDGWHIEDRSSSAGTFVNGERITLRKLEANDKIEFGVGRLPRLRFVAPRLPEAREFMTQFATVKPVGEAAELERLSLCLQAACKLSTTGVLHEILATLIEATLRLTGAERGYVFLRDQSGALRLTSGRDNRGNDLLDDNTISRSILDKAFRSGSAFLIADTTQSEMAQQRSIMDHDLRRIICIPLMRRHGAGAEETPTVQGVLYLDSHVASRDLSGVGRDLLHAVAREAAALVENAQLAQAEQAARRYEQELAIASLIQQGLMDVQIPHVSFATVVGKNIPCKDIGGDFFDVISTADSLTVVVGDVSGKGVSAALLASILQGLVYAQTVSGMPPAHIAEVANDFICQKDLQNKYSTLLILRLNPAGELEYLCCGHVAPLLIRDGHATRLTEGLPPVGLVPGLKFASARLQLFPGDQVVMVTDGVTEARDANGEFFGNERLDQAVLSDNPFDSVFAVVDAFRGPRPLDDDCTVVQLTYTAG